MPIYLVFVIKYLYSAIKNQMLSPHSKICVVIVTAVATRPSTSNLRRGQSQSPSPSPSPKTRHTLAEIKQRDDTYFNKLSLKQATPNKNNPKANPPSNMTDIPT